MNENIEIYSAESVGKGHPDKICDQISDKILDEALKQDKNSHIACEVAAMNRLIVVGGEIKTDATINVQKCVWDVIKPLGYDEHFFTIISNLNQQSGEIDAKVEKANIEDVGAGDQGITTGYATNETEKYKVRNGNYLPLEAYLASYILQRIEDVRINPNDYWTYYILADTKSQIELIKDKNSYQIKKIILAIQHRPFNEETRKELNTAYIVTPDEFKKQVKNFTKRVLAQINVNIDENIISVNGYGEFTIGGPVGDSGLTGRKLVVDNYGPSIQIGGGAFSGKDASKVDRSGAYICRWIAKNIVANNLADKCFIQLAWEIGATQPDNLYINTYGTEKVSIEAIRKLIYEKFYDLKLGKLLNALSLRTAIYSDTSTYGHFKESDKPWERIIKF